MDAHFNDVLHVLDLLAKARSRIVETRRDRSSPGLGLLHRLLFQTEAVVSALLDRNRGSPHLKQGFIESKYSSGHFESDFYDASEPLGATHAFLENMRDAALEIDAAVDKLQRQGNVERYLGVEENLELLKAATADLKYSMATFAQVIDSTMPLDVVEDYQALIGRIEDSAFFADVDVIGRVQDVLIEVVANFALPGRAHRGAVERMVMMLEGDITAGWLVEEAVRLYEAAKVQRENGVYSIYFIYMLVSGALLEGEVVDEVVEVDEIGRIQEELRALRETLREPIENVAQLEGMDAYARSVALLVLAVRAYDGPDDPSLLETLSASLDFVLGPVTRSMLLLAMGRLLSNTSVRDSLGHEEMVRYIMSISRWIDCSAANVRRMSASSLAACLGPSSSKSTGKITAQDELKQAAHAAGIGVRLVRQLSRQQDVLGQRATLSALSAMLTEEIAGDLARVPDGSPDPFEAVFSVVTANLDQPRKGSEDVIRQAVRFVHGMVSRSPLARYKALLAGGVQPLERVLAMSSGAHGRNFALLSLYQLSKVSSLAADTYGWSSRGVLTLLNVLVEDEDVSPASQSAALFTLKHVLGRLGNDSTFEPPVSIENRHLEALVKLSSSSSSDSEKAHSEGVRSAAAAVLDQLVEGGGESSPRMADLIDQLQRI